jgi:hypothetical protein
MIIEIKNRRRLGATVPYLTESGAVQGSLVTGEVIETEA